MYAVKRVRLFDKSGIDSVDVRHTLMSLSGQFIVHSASGASRKKTI